EYNRLPDSVDGKQVKVKPPKGPMLTPEKLPEIEMRLKGKAAGDKTPAAPAQPPAPAAPASP
ncbi:MAG: energy transducer TonB, partial [Planctomycetota bacterium]|nr:energy transducer TonB [Planctomycetota bacterium]